MYKLNCYKYNSSFADVPSAKIELFFDSVELAEKTGGYFVDLDITKNTFDFERVEQDLNKGDHIFSESAFDDPERIGKFADLKLTYEKSHLFNFYKDFKASHYLNDSDIKYYNHDIEKCFHSYKTFNYSDLTGINCNDVELKREVINDILQNNPIFEKEFEATKLNISEYADWLNLNHAEQFNKIYQRAEIIAEDLKKIADDIEKRHISEKFYVEANRYGMLLSMKLYGIQPPVIVDDLIDSYRLNENKAGNDVLTALGYLNIEKPKYNVYLENEHLLTGTKDLFVIDRIEENADKLPTLKLEPLEFFDLCTYLCESEDELFKLRNTADLSICNKVANDIYSLKGFLNALENRSDFNAKKDVDNFYKNYLIEELKEDHKKSKNLTESQKNNKLIKIR